MNDRLPRIMGLPDEARRICESYSTVMTDKTSSVMLDGVSGEGWRCLRSFGAEDIGRGFKDISCAGTAPVGKAVY